VKKILIFLGFLLLIGCTDHNGNIYRINEMFIEGKDKATAAEYLNYYGEHSNDDKLIVELFCYYNDCMEVLKYNLEEKNILWDEIKITIDYNSFSPERIATLYQGMTISDYDIYLSTGNKTKLSFMLDRNGEGMKKYLKENIFAAEDLKEARYIYEMISVFQNDKGYFPSSNIVAGREVYFLNNAGENVDKKEDREDMFINYSGVSKDLCQVILNLMINSKIGRDNVTVRHLNFWNVFLNNEKLNMNYKKYNFNNICLESNKVNISYE